MRILFTGFTSRTVGSESNIYDYMSNVFVLEKALRLAGHDVDVRPVSLETDPCVEEDYDAAVVGIAACQGLSSRYKLGACWALHRFGKRAGIFPSDGKNIAVFPSSVLTCISGNHFDKVQKRHLDPVEYFLGDLQQERNNVVDQKLGHQPELMDVWRAVLKQFPYSVTKPECAWNVLIPTHSWGSELVYRRHFGRPVTLWDPTNVAIPMQFPDGTLALDGRLVQCHTALANERSRQWVVSSLQDQAAWIDKQRCKWPVLEVGNKRKARAGDGLEYMPEKDLIERVYTKNWGHLAFGYPLADGGWWRMRYVHAAMAGIVTCCDQNDARKMPGGYQFTRTQIEGMSDDSLARLAIRQWEELQAASWPAERAVETVDGFVKSLVA